MKPLPRNERLLDLLAAHAVSGLSAAEIADMESLKALEPGADFEMFERAAAAADLATIGKIEAAPAAMVQKLKAGAQKYAGERPVTAGRISADQISVAPSRFLQRAGWLAAAACLVIAVAGWWPRLGGGGTGTADVRTFASAHPDATTSPVGDFNSLTDGAPPEIRGVKGEVVWSDSAQKGYLKLTGMPANDPTKEQYQLWIVDGTRGLQQRISGAIFDVPKDVAAGKGEVVIPIDPQLHVNKAAVFAVTIEKAGGVWVSDMTRRAVIAKVPGT